MERIERQEGAKVDASFRRVRQGEKVKSRDSTSSLLLIRENESRLD